MQVAKWDDTLALRLPPSVVEALGLKEGDEITLEVAGDRTVRLIRVDERASALARLEALARPMPPGWRFSRAEVNQR